MLFYLFDYLDRAFDFPGAGVFQYISFRSALAALGSLLVTILLAPWVISLLKKTRLTETVRDLRLEGQKEKDNTPTMGGILILCGIFIPTLLFAKISNPYVCCLLVSMLWLGAMGFLDDYIKVRRGNKAGLRGRFKIIGQVVLGIGVALFFLYHPAVGVREFAENGNFEDIRSLRTTIPFIKNNELDYALIFKFLGNFSYFAYATVVILVVTAVSNSANLSDGLDGLASGNAAIAGLILAIFAYLSGNIIFSNYLNIMYIPRLGEVVIFCSAFVGACIGFLWSNTYPAKIFMGDTGSLPLGGGIAVLSMVVRKELLLPLVCGVFFIEGISVILQVGYFKYTKYRSGTGKRIFLMAPLHHHYQKLGIHEATIVSRLWIVGILLGTLALVTLKLR